MKKVSMKMFFTVLWRGLCQAIGWFCGLFGYKRDGKFAKCLWGMFATSGTILITLFALVSLYDIGQEAYNKYLKNSYCDLETCYHSEQINGDIYYHNTMDGKGFIYNKRTGDKLVKHIMWIAKPTSEKDSLICFSNGKKRGYFSKNTGKVILEPKYDHAWIFSDGIASVEEDDNIRFIDTTGKTIIDKKMVYNPNMEGYVFHGGYCVIDTDDGEKHGLMDMTGKIVLPMEYSSIRPTNDFELWLVEKEEMSGVLDKEMNPVIPLMECAIFIGEGTIDATMRSDHTMRKYDMQGRLINDFYYSSIRMLEYDKDEIIYKKDTEEEDDENYVGDSEEYWHPKATARLRAYIAGEGYEGLITSEGRLVTMPLYSDINAIGPDLYLCATTNGDKVIVNGKGEIVK